MSDGIDLDSILKTGFFTTSRARLSGSPSSTTTATPSSPFTPRSFPSLARRRRRRPSYPPPPSAEDEIISLGKEIGSLLIPVRDEEPQSRGEIDQLPIIIDVFEYNPERRFVVLPGLARLNDDSGAEEDKAARKRAHRRAKSSGAYKPFIQHATTATPTTSTTPTTTAKPWRTMADSDLDHHVHVRETPRPDQEREPEPKPEPAIEPETETETETEPDPEPEPEPESEIEAVSVSESENFLHHNHHHHHHHHNHHRSSQGSCDGSQSNSSDHERRRGRQDLPRIETNLEDLETPTQHHHHRSRSDAGDLSRPSFSPSYHHQQQQQQQQHHHHHHHPHHGHHTPHTPHTQRHHVSKDEYLSPSVSKHSPSRTRKTYSDDDRSSGHGRKGDRLWDGRHWRSLTPSIDGRSVDGRSVDGRSMDDRSVDGRSVDGRSVDGRSVDRRSVDGRSVDGRSSSRYRTSHSRVSSTNERSRDSPRHWTDDHRSPRSPRSDRSDDRSTRRDSFDSVSTRPRETDKARAPSTRRHRHGDRRGDRRGDRHGDRHRERDSSWSSVEGFLRNAHHRIHPVPTDDGRSSLGVPSEDFRSSRSLSRVRTMPAPSVTSMAKAEGGVDPEQPRICRSSATFPIIRNEYEDHPPGDRKKEHLPYPDDDDDNDNDHNSNGPSRDAWSEGVSASGVPKQLHPGTSISSMPHIPPVIDELSVNSDQDVNLTAASSPMSAHLAPSLWQPPAFDPEHEKFTLRAAAERPVGAYRRYSDAVNRDDSQEQRLPECARTVPVAGLIDWLTLPRTDFNICPGCYGEVFAPTQYRTHFQPLLRPTTAPIACDFGSSPWYRIAWLLTLKERRPDLQLFHRVASVLSSTRDRPCPGAHKALEFWYVVKDPFTRRAVPDFVACHECVSAVEALLPSLCDVFCPRDAWREPVRGVCSLHFRPDREEFPLYFDAFEVAAEAALARQDQLPDVGDLCMALNRVGTFGECRESRRVVDGYWYWLTFLPEFTICGECYDEVVRPQQQLDGTSDDKTISPHDKTKNNKVNHDGEEKNSSSNNDDDDDDDDDDDVSNDRDENKSNANSKSNGSCISGRFLPKPQKLPVATCQLYSPRMRDVFRRACRRGDAEYLKARVLERRLVEDDLHAKFVNLVRDGRRNRWTEEQIDKLAREWRKWE